MIRRQFLKVAMYSIPAISVGVKWYVEQLQVNQHKERLNRALNEESDLATRRLQSLGWFVQNPLNSKILGYSGDLLKAVLFRDLARSTTIKKLKETGVIKAFIDESVVFTPLFRAAKTMEGKDFAESYYDFYPDKQKWWSHLTKDTRQSLINKKIELQKNIIAFNQFGIEVLPYDKRENGDLGALRKRNEEIAQAFKDLDREVLEEYSGIGGIKGLFSELYKLGGAFVIGRDFSYQRSIEVNNAIIRELLVNRQPTAVKVFSLLELESRDDKINSEYISSQKGADEPVLVVADHRRIEQSNGLNYWLKVRDVRTESLVYYDDRFPGQYNSYMEGHLFPSYIHPDYVLSLSDGRLVPTNSYEQRWSKETRKMYALQK